MRTVWRPIRLTEEVISSARVWIIERSFERATGRFAWLLWAICVALTAGTIISGVLSKQTGQSDLSFGAVLFVVGFLVFPTVGALIAIRHPANRIGWLFLAVGVIWIGINHFGHFYTEYGLVRGPDALPATVPVAWVTTWGWLPSLGLLVVFLPLLFPDGRLPGRTWRPVAWLAGVSITTGSLAIALIPGPLGSERQFETITNPFGIERYASLLSIGEGASVMIMMLCGLAAIVSLFRRLRRADHVQRQQIKWVVYAASLFVLAIMAEAVARLMSPTHESGVVGVLSVLALFAVPIAAGVAILQYHLYDIDLIINRTLVYGALTLGVIALYVLVVGYLGRLLHNEQDLWTSLIATGVVAVLFQPLREWFQRGVNRLMYGDRDDPYGVIARLGRRLEATLAPEAVLPAIVETIAQALKLPYAAISLKQGDEFVPAAISGTPNGSSLRLPLVYQSETVGQLELAPRAPGEVFTTADRQLLEGIAHQAGIAAHAVRLTADLQRSRERLVTTREEERRRIRRDLHDGLGPALASLTLHVDAARNTLRQDPDTTDVLLAELKAQVQTAIGDIRRLVYDLRPPSLDEIGLIGALRAQAGRYGSEWGEREGPAISVEAVDIPATLPAAVEVAAYRIVAEAMTNVVRHSEARNCRVWLWLDDGLQIEVVDDGRGLPDDAQSGIGLRSMRERAEELSGTCAIERRPEGGTRVLARLPLSSTQIGLER